MYDAAGYQVANELDRFAIGDRDQLTYNSDGSLDVLIQHTNPNPDREGNWLPAATGPLGVTMRALRAQTRDPRWAVGLRHRSTEQSNRQPNRRRTATWNQVPSGSRPSTREPPLRPTAAKHAGRARARRFERTPWQGCPLPLVSGTEKALLQAFHGRYWARTSDPQLVELVLSQLS
jgi:Protein of unknown function (DUF1214)